MGHRLRRLAHVRTQLRGRSLAGCTGEPSIPTESTITQQSAGLTTSGTRTVSTAPGAGAAHSIAETVTLDSMAEKTPASSAVAPAHRELSLTCSDGGLGLHSRNSTSRASHSKESPHPQQARAPAKTFG